MQVNRSIPNAISIFRMVLSLLLLVTFDVYWLFACMIVLIGLSDIADGYIARRYNLVSKLGARLDSISDLMFFANVLWIIFLRYDWILMDYYAYIFAIVILKVLSAVLSKIKFGEFVFIHTIANKITGFLIFMSILILPFAAPDGWFAIVFIIGLIAASEELMIILLNKNEIDRDQKEYNQ